MVLIFYLVVLVIFCSSTFLLIKALEKDGMSLWEKHLEWVLQSTDYIFWKISEKRARFIIAAFVLFSGGIGFVFPGQLVLLDQYSIDRALSLNNHAKYQEALEILIDYHKAESPLIQNELGVAYLGLGSFKEAEERFRKALRLQPDYVQPHANLAVLYSITGKASDAAFELRKANSLTKFSLSEKSLYGLGKGFLDDIGLRIFSMLIFGGVGWMLPKIILKWLMARRRRMFDELLPDGLIMATNGLRANMSLGQVLETISEEAPKPLNQEFGLVVKEQKLGKEFNETLRALATRMDTDDTHILVNSIIILREVGGNLTEVFEKLAFTIRERKLVKQKISTMTAEGRSQAVILVILPFVLGWLLDKLNPEVFSLLYTTPLGWLLLIFAFLWGGFGCFSMWKIVQVKV